MKQHILALGAAAALGLASVTHAVVVFGPDDAHPNLPKYFDPANPGNPRTMGLAAGPATGIEQAAGGIGHMLFAPYYNVQGDSTTLITIANTDDTNGKVVKVRFRSAGNSDDVLDFTLLLSPGDVWSAGLGKLDDNWPVINTADNSCILPVGGREIMQTTGEKMKDSRLPQTITEDARKLLMSEGYIEVLNMADVPPQTSNAYSQPPEPLTLYEELKHVNGVAPCNNSLVMQKMLETTIKAPAEVAKGTTPKEGSLGLHAPTGGLMGAWLIQNQTLRNSYSGNMTAVRLTDANGNPAYGNIIVAPQVPDPVPNPLNDANIDAQYLVPSGSVAGMTADPLLTTTDPLIKPLWYDLPDMSTPLAPAGGTMPATPLDQAMALDLSRWQIWNDYVSDKDGVVPMWTDWVVSQPTRRYYAAVNYADPALAKAGKKDAIVWNNIMGTASDMSDGVVDDIVVSADPFAKAGKPADNVYDVLQLVDTDEFGPFACLPSSTVNTSAVDTEENFGTVVLGAGAFSPGTPDPGTVYCGEVFVLSFAADSVFDATVTRKQWAKVVGTAGIAQLNFNDRELPVVGFAATAYGNQTTGISYGATWPHRWN